MHMQCKSHTSLLSPGPKIPSRLMLENVQSPMLPYASLDM